MNIEDILNDLPLDEDVRTKLKEAWDKELSSAKAVAAASAKKDIVENHKKAMDKMQSAMEALVIENVKSELEELAEDVKAVKRQKVKYQEARSRLVKEAKEFARDLEAKYKKIVEQTLAEEVSELAEDVKANNAATAKAIREAKEQLAMEVQKIKTKSARIMEYIVETEVNNALLELREDIKEAKKDQFGRELYESFYHTFRRQFFNSNKEFKKVVNENKELREGMVVMANKAKKKIMEAKKREHDAIKKASMTLNEAARRRKISELVSALPSSARKKAELVLENVEHNKLDEVFKSFLDGFVSNHQQKKVMGKKTLKEGSAPQKRQRKVIMETSGYVDNPRKSEETATREDKFLNELRLLSGVQR